MVTVIGHTTLPLQSIDVSAFIAELGTAATTAFGLPPHLRSIFLYPLPAEYATAGDGYQITFILYTAPGKTIEHRRAMVKALSDAVQSRRWDKPVKVVVTIKEHTSDYVGVDGVLRADVV